MKLNNAVIICLAASAVVSWVPAVWGVPKNQTRSFCFV